MVEATIGTAKPREPKRVDRHRTQATYHIIIIISYHIVDFKWQNRLKVGTDKPKLKLKMQKKMNFKVAS